MRVRGKKPKEDILIIIPRVWNRRGNGSRAKSNAQCGISLRGKKVAVALPAIPWIGGAKI